MMMETHLCVEQLL